MFYCGNDEGGGPEGPQLPSHFGALSENEIRGLKRQGLTEEERFAVADHTVAQLKQRGDPWRPNEEAKPAPPPST